MRNRIPRAVSSTIMVSDGSVHFAKRICQRMNMCLAMCVQRNCHLQVQVSPERAYFFHVNKGAVLRCSCLHCLVSVTETETTCMYTIASMQTHQH